MKNFIKFIGTILALLIALLGCGREVSEIISNEQNITWWSQNRYAHVSNMGDSQVYQQLMDITGVDVTFIHVPKGEHRERFLALMNEEILPDIITHDFINDYPGGAEKALNDGVIAPLNDIIENYCPNLEAFLQQNPEIKESISTKDGRVFCFPSVQLDREIRTYIGPYIREDYLDELNLEAPETVSEWYNVLTVFRDELGITPLSFYGGKIIDTNFLIGAFGLSWDFYIEDETVKFGPMEDGFEDFMVEFKKWYDEDLISKGVFTDAQSTYIAKAKRGNIGVYVDYITSIALYESEIDGAVFSPLNYPVLNTGQRAFSSHIAPVFIPYASAYISTDNKDIVGTAKLLDYAYSEDGGLLYNFGILGESYEIIDGSPEYTAEMLNDPDGFSTAIKRYLASGAFVRDPDQFRQMLVTNSQVEAVNLWSDTEAEQHQLPQVVFSAQQAEIVAGFNNTYKDVLYEWIKDFCLLDSERVTVQQLQDTLREMGIEEVLDIYQEVVYGK